MDSRIACPEERAARSSIRILAVDASIASRQRISDALASDPAMEIAGTAASASMALKRAAQLAPDVVVLGPGIQGVDQMARDLRALNHRIRIVSFESETADKRAGAELAERIRNLFAFVNAKESAKEAKSLNVAAPRKSTSAARRRIVVIGVSTGGPEALATIVPMIPADFSIPVLIVQHMPAAFTGLLAERLSARTSLRVTEATEGAVVEPGTILIAPGDFHTRVRALEDGRIVTTLDQGPLENSCRPSVDALFRSVAETYGAATIAVVLTGMGRDGAAGAALLRQRGAYIVAQDQASSVVWGMPRAVVDAGAANAVVDLNAIVPEILKQI